MLIKVIAAQIELGRTLNLEENLMIFKQRPDFVCLPEYFLVEKTSPDFARSALKIRDNVQYLQTLSDGLSTCLIGGSVVEAEGDSLYNSCYIFNRGQSIGRYRKLNPVEGEMNKGILPGDRIFSAVIEDVRVAVLICADALNIGIFEELARHKIDIIFIPTTSPFRPGETRLEKFKRDNDIYVRGAEVSSSYIVKCCGIGTLFGKKLQGRSLVASPWGIIRRVEPHAEQSESLMSLVLDIEELRDFRNKKKRAPAGSKVSK
ncbi:MAG: carbon-nitrogen hydrolase family protein [Candidatus Zixiibacteriota bacterium]